MANYSNLLAQIAANIYSNNNQDITGDGLQTQLNAMVASLGAGYQFMGVAHPSDTPSGYADLRAFWLAGEAGTYTNFGGLVVADGEVAVIKYDGNGWSKEVTGAASAEQVSEIGQEVGDINDFLRGTNQFDSDAVVGYITPNGSFSGSDIGAIVTKAVPVSEGQRWHFEGGWQDNASFGSVWGYSGVSFSNGIKILDCLAYQSTDFVIPSGVNYLRAWSLTSRSPSLSSAENLEREVENIVAEQIGVNWDNSEVIVATRNAADYNSIREIIASISDASASKPYTIIVPKGRWQECDIQGKEYVKIVGEDRELSIIYNDGNSAKLTPADYSYSAESNKALSSVDKIYKHIVFAKQDVILENLTLELTTGKYCAHLDNAGFARVGIKNCRLVGKDVNYCVGIGIRGGQSVSIEKSIIERVESGNLGVFAHNWNNQSKPSAIDITDCYFKNCGFICIDELGSEQEDAWNLLDCYSDVGGAINAMVDNNGSTTFWINENNVLESDPTKVPYCIKLNCCGSNVGKIQKNRFASTTTIARPDILKYIIADCILAIDGTYNVDSHICGYVTGNSSVIGEYNNTTLPFIGVVDSIVDGECYIIKKGHTVIVSIANLYGAGAGIGNLVYRRDNGYLTTAQSQSIDDTPVGIIWGDYYGVGRQIVLF